MSALAVAPMTFGQVSVWHDVAQMPPDRRHEANMLRTGPVDPGVSVADLLNAFRGLHARHEALRTTYDFADPAEPRQVVHPADARKLPVRCVPVAGGVDPAAAAQEIGERLARQPFKLTVEDSWRAVVLLVDDRPVYLAVVLHHIAVDLWGLNLLGGDLPILLRGGRPGPADSPLELARAQRSSMWQSRNAYAARHLRAAYTAVAQTAAGETVESPAAVIRATLRSSVALPSAAEYARSLRISLPSLVLAAYCFIAHETTRVDTILVNAMCANRQYPGTAALVSSMNQWGTFASQHRPGESFNEFARRTHWTSVRAGRHGCYDPYLAQRIRDEVVAATGPVRPEFSFNFVDDGAAVANPASNRPDSPPWSLTHDEPLRVTGPTFYLVATRGADLSLTCRVMWEGFDFTALEDFLVSVHALLTATNGHLHTHRGAAVPTA